MRAHLTLCEGAPLARQKTFRYIDKRQITFVPTIRSWCRETDQRKTNHRTERVFSDLLIFVSHHIQRNVLSHVVQLIGEAVGAGNVDGGAVIMIFPDCNEKDISYTP